MSSPPKNNNQDTVKHSRPIPINTGYGTRRRSVSISSSDSSSSPTSPPQPPTPLSNSSPPRMVPTNLSPSSSPILSYFMSQSPTKTPPTTFPFTRKFGGAPPVFEEEEAAEELPAVAHARRASTAGRFGPQATAPPAMPDPHCERGASVLRRLSLGNAFSRTAPTERMPSPPRPATPPNTAVPNTAVDNSNGSQKMPNVNAQGARMKRSATVNVDGGGRTRRAPSPMGERILKGHFDGFN